MWPPVWLTTIFSSQDSRIKATIVRSCFKVSANLLKKRSSIFSYFSLSGNLSSKSNHLLRTNLPFSKVTILKFSLSLYSEFRNFHGQTGYGVQPSVQELAVQIHMEIWRKETFLLVWIVFESKILQKFEVSIYQKLLHYP